VTVLGRPEPPPLTWTRVAIVAAVACAVVLLGTIRPALRGIRQSTLRSLAAGPRPPRRPGRLARLAANLGVPLPGVLGLRSAWRRPGRLLTNAAGLLLGVAMIVVALALRDSLGLLSLKPSEPGHAARDAAGNHAVLRAVGATPRQTVTALVVSQLGACAIAVVVGIPLGLGLWSLMEGGDLPQVSVSTRALVLLAAAVPVVFAAIVSVPARLLARRPVAPLLTYE
jgi:putative ABC transport system permease protein